MKRWTRGLLSLLLAVLTVALFVGCGGETSPSSSGGEGGEESSPVGIALSSLSEYVIVRSKSANLEQKNAAYGLKKDLDALFECEISLYGDGEAPVDFEILVGETNRPESVAFMKTLRYADHGYAVVGNKIVVGGHSAEALQAAVADFYKDLTALSTEDGCLVEGEYVTNATYAYEDTLVCGLSSKDLSVVYADQKGKDFALILAESLSRRCGYLIKAISQREAESATGNLLLLGVSGQRGFTVPEFTEPSDAYIKTSSDAVLLAGGEFAFEQLCYNLLGEVLGGDRDTIPLPSRSDAKGETLRTVSYNVLVSSRTQERISSLIKSIQWMKPDTIGLQEASSSWMSDFATYLPEYASVGVGRGGTFTEGTYVLYRKDKFTLLDSGTRWLSDTPEVSSKYEESKHPRTYTYAVLKRNSDGAVFVHVNTHLDHSTAIARTKQASVLIKELEKFRKYPVVITGDFNCTSTSDVYSTITAAGYKDSAALAEVAQTSPTFRSSQKVIDFCFVTPEFMQTLHYRVFDGKAGAVHPSDHNAVYIDFVLK